jgi:hypothetical protein
LGEHQEKQFARKRQRNYIGFKEDFMILYKALINYFLLATGMFPLINPSFDSVGVSCRQGNETKWL